MRYVFVCAEHPEYGSNGWRLKSQPNFDPLGGMAVAHDCLEHFNDSDQPADEFMALGASLFVRPSDYYEGKGKIHTNPGVHIASDLPEIMRHIVNEGYTLPPAPRTRPVCGPVEHEMDTVFEEFQREMLNEYDGQELTPDEDTERSIRSYMRIGYRRAIRRYKGRQYEVTRLFNNIERAADKALTYAEALSELSIRIQFRRLDFTASVSEEMYA